MKEILYNLALIDAMSFCKEHNINCSGTHLIKYPRKFTYVLVKSDTGRVILTTWFSKMSVPTHFIHK